MWVDKEWGIKCSRPMISKVFTQHGGSWHTPQLRHPAVLFPENVTKYKNFVKERNENNKRGKVQVVMDESCINASYSKIKVRARKGNTSHCSAGNSKSQQHKYPGHTGNRGAESPSKKLPERTLHHGTSGIGKGDAIVMKGAKTVREQKDTWEHGKAADLYCALVQHKDTAQMLCNAAYDKGTMSAKERLWDFFFGPDGLLPQLRQRFPFEEYGCITIWADNLGAVSKSLHHDPALRARIERKINKKAHFQLRHFAPYHSWSNPTEYAFRHLKHILRVECARGKDRIYQCVQLWQDDMRDDKRVHGLCRQADWWEVPRRL